MDYPEDLTGKKIQYIMDVYDGKWIYVGTHETIARELISKIDPENIDIWALAAAIHEVEVGDILTQSNWVLFLIVVQISYGYDDLQLEFRFDSIDFAHPRLRPGSYSGGRRSNTTAKAEPFDNNGSSLLPMTLFVCWLQPELWCRCRLWLGQVRGGGVSAFRFN